MKENLKKVLLDSFKQIEESDEIDKEFNEFIDEETLKDFVNLKK